MTVRHDRNDVRITTHIGPNGADLVRCDARPGGSGCPAYLAIAGGSSEQDVWHAFGRPSSISYTGDHKVLDYASLGVSLTLTKFTVTSISVRPTSNFSAAFLGRWLRVLLP